MMPMPGNSHKELIVPLLIADTLLILAVLILVFRWGRLGVWELVMAGACVALSATFFAKGLRMILSRRKSKPDEPWKPIEP